MAAEIPERRFLLRVAELLHAYGTPAHRLERVLSKMADTLGVQASFLSSPTAVICSFGRGAEEQTHLVRIEPGAIDLGKLVDFDRVMEDVEHGRSTVAQGLDELERVASRPPYAPWITALAFGLASASAARFFGGGSHEVVASLVVGVLTFALGKLLPRRPSGVDLFEPVAAFLAASLAMIAARWIPLDHRVVTLSGLIILLPGLSLTTAMTELATRHWTSGASRLAGAAAVFLTILLGVALAWRLGDHLPAPLEPLEGDTGALGEVLAVLVSPFAFAVLLEARWKEWPVIFLVCVAGYAAARGGAVWLGGDLGPFLGALVIGVASNVYARRLDHPALVPQTPGILFLVPGSLGYRSLTSFLERDSTGGMEWAFQTGVVGVALVGGLLAANAILPPRRVL